MHKTGSTAIQDYLIINKDELNNKNILFPETGTMSQGAGTRHIYLSKAFQYPNPTNSMLWTELLREIEIQECNLNILSHEDFLSPKKICPHTMDFLQANFDVYLLCYFREPIDYMNAKYKEWIRRQNFTGESKDFILKHRGYLDWKSMLKPWASYLGEDHVFCRKFARLEFESGSIINDFKKFLRKELKFDLPKQDKSIKSPNESINNDKVLSCLIRNQYFGGHKKLNGSQRRSFKKYLNTFINKDKSGLILTNEDISLIQNECNKSIEYMYLAWGINFETCQIKDRIFDPGFHSIEKRQAILEELRERL